MNVCERRKLVFLHITKTAGVSIGEALGFGSKVSDAQHDVAMDAAERYADYLRLCFVRNPWARALSGFRYTRRMVEKGVVKSDPARLFIESRPTVDFRAFVADFLQGAEINRILHFRQQMVWIRRGQPQFIGRVERMDADVAALSRLLGEPLPVRRLNASAPGEALEDAYDDRTRAIVGRLYRDDVRFLNYRFPASGVDGGDTDG
ncbi:MAG: hypothetical protein DI565_15570 [Ancylobacter novellus]|uniref:Sulfotransferase family protein n=1 Tax=Ancylobacter novellus TaxID=921 RepID=A0A2W5KAP9_ANCNO|nr:MAG: hypothetical protein DI565_15570 [Ancylobacter novellus]